MATSRAAPLLPLFFVLASVAGAQGVADPATYAGRTVDIRPYTPANALVSYETRPETPGLFAIVRMGGVLHMLRLPADSLVGASLPQTRTLDVFPKRDLARQHVSVPVADDIAHTFIARADSANDERFDLYLTRPGQGDLRRLTMSGRIEVPWYPFHGRVALIEEVGAQEPYAYCLELLNQTTLVRRRMLCTDSTTEFTTPLAWRPDGRAFAIQTKMDGRENLALFTLRGDSASWRLLLPDDSLVNVRPVAWADSRRLRFMASRNGIRNLYDIDSDDGVVHAVTRFATRHRLAVRDIDGRTIVLGLGNDERGIRLTAYLPPDTMAVASVLLPRGTQMVGFTGRSWLLMHASAAAPSDYSLLAVHVQGATGTMSIQRLPRAGPAPQACAIEPVSYVTHDRRTVHAFLRTPLKPLPDRADRLAIVYAYYGGSDEYDALASFWCEAGIASLSPDIDRETNGDRGGREIADVLYGARWLRERLGLRERQIGVYGMSQGGYNAMRALTFQPETDSINVMFDFGFGIAQSGYSSMLTILHHTNTQSPEIIATGDPKTAAGRMRLRERSPLDQVARLNATLLLIHGTSDRRVQIEESRQMFAAARAAGKDVTLVELPGEGHGVEIQANLRRYYTAQLRFLEHVRSIHGSNPVPRR